MDILKSSPQELLHQNVDLQPNTLDPGGEEGKVQLRMIKGKIFEVLFKSYSLDIC